MPSICSSDVGFPEWSDIGTFEHLLELLDVMNDAFNIHPEQYSGAVALRICQFHAIHTDARDDPRPRGQVDEGRKPV